MSFSIAFYKREMRTWNYANSLFKKIKDWNYANSLFKIIKDWNYANSLFKIIKDWNYANCLFKKITDWNYANSLFPLILISKERGFFISYNILPFSCQSFNDDWKYSHISIVSIIFRY